MIEAGKLDKRVTLQQREAVSPDRTSSGAPDKAWADVAEVWASIEPLRGRELFAADAVQSKVSVRIRIRYRAGVTAAMRVVRGSTVYNIEAVINPRAANVELELMCSEGLNRG